MDRALPTILRNLIPAYAGPLPAELIDLAGSLLAQSRNKASNLKAEEEIARSYACCNIACDRLKQPLSLPKVEVNPPCPPRVYKKLHIYFNGVLPAGTKQGTPRKKKETPSTQSPAETTPSKERPAPRTSHLTPSRRGRDRPGSNFETPEWVMPVIRAICQKYQSNTAPHHISAGVSSILAYESQKDIATSDRPEIKIPALVIVVFCLVTTRLAGVETPSARYQELRDGALSLMQDIETPEAESGLRSTESQDVDDLMRQVATQPWTQMDWFTNIPLAAETTPADQDTEMMDVEGMIASEDDAIIPDTYVGGVDHPEDVDVHKTLLPGLGTMMHDRIDHLSDEKRRRYRDWKKDILQRLREAELSHGRSSRAIHS